ncbi:MAG: 2-dehydropantoate 2-reductase [Deltaproteobacteria bacterium]|nr:2-dehydropantoate 2-reductase [Deltaproteobacteria bacterium]
MKEIENVAVLGAGAMGSYFASRFFETSGLHTSLVARGERSERLSRDGLVVNGKPCFVPVLDPDKVDATADLIIVALKHHHLPEAIGDLKNLVGENTTIISIMNGLDSEPYIGSVYGPDKMLYAVSVGIDALRQGNRVRFSNPGKHYFGEAVNKTPSERVVRVQHAFDRAGINWETPSDMIRVMWWKFMVNVGMNQASAVMGAPYGVFQTSTEASAVMKSLMLEVVALAQPAGVDLSEEDMDEWDKVMMTLSKDGKTSMLQDVEAGRKTEVEVFGGKVVQLSKEFHIPTPVNETLFNIIRVMEAKALKPANRD